MRALNLGIFAVVGSVVGLTACGDDEADDPIIAPGGASSTGGAFATGGSSPGSGGAKATGGTGTATGGFSTTTGGTGQGGRGGGSATGGAGGKASFTGCPTMGPDDGAARTLPAPGELESTFGHATCESERSAEAKMKTAWDGRSHRTNSRSAR